ncbi:hypothetical protein EVAR_17117_1 [Eumeta japonica]|uniref:PiggyBac transposable element-derived protein domain-containing protein n=1 Tax=Eumeta variegata TaxID=151549 RepID=A0A4C1UN51_EUMVA|nr:hypothetical protein EVAR_17117_1 [Eumeta japonica]
MDNWFTSIPLTEDLQKDHNVITVDTVRKNKPEIPNEFKQKGTSKKRLPEITGFYNKTKSGVDLVDKLIGSYSVACICNRCPLRLFLTVLDVGAVNGHRILDSWTPERTMERKVFLKSLAFDLFPPQLQPCLAQNFTTTYRIFNPKICIAVAKDFTRR